jgi:hypothetical protein
MDFMPPRVRPRRGAWWGSRRARAGAAACLASLALGLGTPGPAAAYPCADAVRPQAATGSADCRATTERPTRERKRGSASSVAVFVVAIAVVLLIPIGARGIPSSVDPYSRELPLSERKRRTR